MKPSIYGWLLLAFLAGGLGAWLVLPRAGRYHVEVHDSFMVRVDTATGKTWCEVDQGDHYWHLIGETNAPD